VLAVRNKRNLSRDLQQNPLEKEVFSERRVPPPLKGGGRIAFPKTFLFFLLDFRSSLFFPLDS